MTRLSLQNVIYYADFVLCIRAFGFVEGVKFSSRYTHTHIILTTHIHNVVLFHDRWPQMRRTLIPSQPNPSTITSKGFAVRDRYHQRLLRMHPFTNTIFIVIVYSQV